MIGIRVNFANFIRSKATFSCKNLISSYRLRRQNRTIVPVLIIPALKPVAELASFWNKPIISWVGTDSDFGDKIGLYDSWPHSWTVKQSRDVIRPRSSSSTSGGGSSSSLQTICCGKSHFDKFNWIRGCKITVQKHWSTLSNESKNLLLPTVRDGDVFTARPYGAVSTHPTGMVFLLAKFLLKTAWKWIIWTQSRRCMSLVLLWIHQCIKLVVIRVG